MSQQIATMGNNVVNTFKWVVVIAFLAAGVGGNYVYADQSLLIRVIGLLFLAALAIGTALQTNAGKRFWQFAMESRTELRKVVWPSKHETLQMTGFVIAVVVIVSLILWGTDTVLLRLIAWLTGYGAM